MGDLATAMRDPIFYRWHSYIDDMFQEHKATLPKYEVSRLDYPGISVDTVEVENVNGDLNQFNTFWQQDDIDLSRGMDFQPKGSVFVRVVHLQHEPFKFRITVMNHTSAQKMGTCRIFLAPKHDERGGDWHFRDQRTMFIELDKFTVTCE